MGGISWEIRNGNPRREAMLSVDLAALNRRFSIGSFPTFSQCTSQGGVVKVVNLMQRNFKSHVARVDKVDNPRLETRGLGVKQRTSIIGASFSQWS
jgi:hypothetical protein